MLLHIGGIYEQKLEKNSLCFDGDVERWLGACFGGLRHV